jgi:hypothetical protein
MCEEISVLSLIINVYETPLSSAGFVTIENTDVTQAWARHVDMP